AVLVAQAAVGVAETWYVSFLGRDALAGVSLVLPIFMLMTMLSNGGVGSGVASAAARAVGAGRPRDADAVALHAVLLGLGLGAAFTAGAWLGGPRLYRALGGEGASLEVALAYSNALFAGSVPFWIVNLLAAALRGAGDVRLPAKVTLAGAAVVVAASPALVFGLGPIPALGAAGAGVAVALYYVGAAAFLLRRLGSGRSTLRLAFGPPRRRHLADIARVGLPTAVSAVQPNLTVVVLTGAVGHFGVDALAAYGTASRLDYVLVPVLFGLGSAVLTMVGVNVGAGRIERARRVAWVGALVAFAGAGAVGLAAAFAPAIWLGLFSREPAVVATGALYLRWVAPLYGLFGAGFVMGFAAQGAARALYPLLAGTARMAVAAGLGAFAVTRLGAGLSTLFALVALSTLAYAGITLAAVLSGRVFREPAPAEPVADAGPPPLIAR
ncbi:MAG TPA: MATE family efflux transporter, partial [Polyangiaceae bacterium]|nr:MATE family efflux transporter [Polyangiaceae bacterium]